jgi:CRP/FNR family transcriptional regulator, cyclic AMP receptor protein
MSVAIANDDRPLAWLAARPGGRFVRVLDEDLDLPSPYPAQRARRAREASHAALLRLPTGVWEPPVTEPPASGLGLLILNGLLMRTVSHRGRCGGELLAGGDLIRPEEAVDDPAGTLAFHTGWRVLVPCRLAVLDRGWLARMAPYPEIIAALTARGLERAARVSQMLTLVREPRLEERLWLLLWHLADRFGSVHGDGVHVSLPLTHDLLARLACAQRPSVSSALGRLAHDGRVRRTGNDWVLSGPAPD